MDNERRNSLESKENFDNVRQNSRDNTEYVPTRCRITKPIPPKPATNPMQFVKIGPCHLYRKAQEQLKKVEEVKSIRHELRDEAEDWQANLDNWKSSRRKRQEHIIERVVEVKKFEQQELEKGRRKSKTFNEILEERNKRKNKLILSVYENDDPNDLSDYGLSKTQNSEEKNQNETQSIKQAVNIDDNNEKENKSDTDIRSETKLNDNLIMLHDFSECGLTNQDLDNTNLESEQYTYESAIQGYRTRVISKTNLNSALSFRSSTDNNNSESKPELNTSKVDVDNIVSKGSILKRKELFENDKLFEMKHYESNTSLRLSEDFVHSQSLKERLLSLEKYTDQSLVHSDTTPSINNLDNKNNNNSKINADQFVRNRVSTFNNLIEAESTVSENENKTKQKSVISNNWSDKSVCNPESEVFINKMENKQAHRSLDNLTDSTGENMPLDRVESLDGLEYCHSNYPASNSSIEMLAYGDTDREDSGIHTADVSCSVSQADEPVEDIPSEDNKRTLVDNQSYPVSLMHFDDVFTAEDFSAGLPVTALEPPKEKPLPTPASNDFESEESELKRMDSIKRIKKEIRMKRSNFLGIDFELDNQQELETSIKKPPDINSFLQRESRLEKQLYRKSQIQQQMQSQSQTPTQSNYSEAGDSQDSGVELERGRLSSDTWCSSLMQTHSRQNSEPCTTNSLTSDEDEITKKEREIIEMVEKEEKWRDTNEFSPTLPVHNDQKQVVTDYAVSEDDEHSEVLRVEHELLQLEREELKRQRENIMFRESQARLSMQPQLCLKNKRYSLEDITGVINQPNLFMYQTKLDNMNYRKSMPELQHEVNIASRIQAASTSITKPVVPPRTPMKELYDDDLCQKSSKVAFPMSRQSLHILSATPRSRLIPQDNWIQQKSKDKFNYNQHWLIQEAEQRRISEQQKINAGPSAQNWKIKRPEKHIPDSIIQTLTQRVQNKININERNIVSRNVNLPHSPHAVGHALPINHSHFMMEESPDKMLSVSGKKKCSYCGHELGRGAAMIIESLCLFYHMDCFKCCVCHVQLGDGLMGTDVRVRNNKLHCHNCYSSDDGVKFSCV